MKAFKDTLRDYCKETGGRLDGIENLLEKAIGKKPKSVSDAKNPPMKSEKPPLEFVDDRKANESTLPSRAGARA